NTYLPAVEPGNALGPRITSPDSTLSPTFTDVITVLYQDNLTTGGVQVGMDSAPINASTCKNGAFNDTTGLNVTFDSNCFNLTTLASNGIQINPGDLILFSNANGNAVQYVTSVSGQTLTFDKGDPYGLNQTGASAGTIVQIQNTN